MKNRKPLNFIPLHEVRELKGKRPKKKSLYSLKKIISSNFRSPLKSSVKNRNEYNDYDYFDKLNDKEKKWLTKFHREYLNADFKTFKKPLHKNKNLKKTCYDMNNFRNRDTFSQKKASRNLEYLGDKVFELIDNNLEISNIEKIELIEEFAKTSKWNQKKLDILKKV